MPSMKIDDAISEVAGYSAGTLQVKAGDGPLFAHPTHGDPSVDRPLHLQTGSRSADRPAARLICTGRSGDLLTVSLLKGAVSVGHVVAASPCAAMFEEWGATYYGEGPPGGMAGDVGDSYCDELTGDRWAYYESGWVLEGTFRGPPGETGPGGPAGADGSAWRDGAGDPPASLGADGDYYLDSTTGRVYRRADGAYSQVATIMGPPGADGADGTNGADGSPGADGADGQDGAPGSVWRNGAGAPSDSLGVDGDYYLDTTAGDVYQKATATYGVVANIKGPQGPAGPNTVSGLIVEPADGSVKIGGSGTAADPYVPRARRTKTWTWCVAADSAGTAGDVPGAVRVPWNCTISYIKAWAATNPTSAIGANVKAGGANVHSSGLSILAGTTGPDEKTTGFPASLAKNTLVTATTSALPADARQVYVEMEIQGV